MSIFLNQLAFSYANNSQLPMINIDNWSVASGEKVFIYGPSGSGKSTLLKLISGLISPTNGAINVLGQSLDTMKSYQRDKFRANNIGYIAQTFNLIEYLSAIDNIKLAHHFAKTVTKQNLATQVAYLLNTLKFDSKDWYRPVEQLSIGQQQRVAIARAFINRPELIIADEPTSALDTDSRDSFMSLLIQLCEDNQTTLVFASHDTQLSAYFDRADNFIAMNSNTGCH